MAKKKNKILQPWDFVPANAETREGFPVGAGHYSGKAVKAKMGRIRESSMIKPPRDKTASKKPITQA